MSTITVSDRSSLLDALASAGGGDTIVLQDGHYGSVTVSADYASPVTVRAADPLDATISSLKVLGASNVRFDGINFHSGVNGGPGGRIVSVEGSRNVAIVNSEVSGRDDNDYTGHNGIYVNRSSFVTLGNNDVHDVDNGIMVFGANNITVSGNKVDYYANDALKFAGLRASRIEDNISNGHVFKPAGAHNDFMQFQGNSSDVTISGNVFLASTIATSQGIFMNNASFHDMTIEGNIIYTGMLRGISVSSGSGIVVRNNTLLDIPHEAHNGPIIFAPSGSVISNNIVSAYSGGTFGSNLKVQSTRPGDDYYVEDYFANGAEGRGVTIRDLIPVDGSLAETKGAAARLKELLGGAVAPPVPGSSPEPEPSPEPSPSPEAAPPPRAGKIAINAGGSGDAHFSGGHTYKTGAAIAKTFADAVYRSERYGDFDYSLALQDGTYDVTFKFAEVYFDRAGKRVFDVRAEGALVIDDLDVFRMAGGKNVAYDRTVEVEVSDGRLDLDFVGEVENAKLSGLEIAPSDGFDLL